MYICNGLPVEVGGGSVVVIVVVVVVGSINGKTFNLLKRYISLFYLVGGNRSGVEKGP